MNEACSKKSTQSFSVWVEKRYSHTSGQESTLSLQIFQIKTSNTRKQKSQK